MLDTKALEEFNEYAQAAALDVVRIVRIWQTEFGTSNTHVALLPPIYHALVVLLSCRKTSDSTLYESEILDMCIQFRSIGRRWRFAMGAFRMCQVTILNQGKELPFAAQKLFEDFETREWQDKEIRRITSIFPTLGGAINGEEPLNMGDFFENFQRLNVDDTIDRKIERDTSNNGTEKRLARSDGKG